MIERMSNRRILPALILAGSVGFLGLHRLYAGRYVTGLLQLALFTVGAAMLWRDVAGLAGVLSLETIDQVVDWAAQHPVHPLPVLLVSIPVFWALFDCFLLARGRFRDTAGNPITRWV